MPPFKRSVNYVFFSCPRCGNLHESLGTSEYRNGKPAQKCHSCGKLSPIDDFDEVIRPVVGFYCKRCRFYLPDLSGFWLAEGDNLCPECHHVVAVGHSTRGKTPEGTVEKPTAEIRKRSYGMEGGLRILHTAKDWDRLVLRYLNSLAQVESHDFFRTRRSNGLLLLDSKRYLGYLSWDMNEGELPTMRQIFVVPSERGKGHATRLVLRFLSDIAMKRLQNGLQFYVESPNDASAQLLNKLGLADRCAVVHGPI